MALQDYKEPEKRRKGLWPVYGLFMGLAAAAIAYVLSPILYRFVQQRSPRFSIGTLTPNQVQLFFGIIIFLVVISIGSLLLALAAPKKKSVVSEAKLAKEKVKMDAALRARRKRQRELNRKMRAENKRLDG